MKEAITKFDLESAFKALDELDIPKSGKVKANKPALTEIFARKSKFDYLFEEYYDIGSADELGDAKEAREAEIAKAKLDRIEKIVDLDADSPEDLLTSYVGKYIIQCPQCMTLFYKNPEDVVESEDDPSTVNMNEICQHCGNETGYTLVGKVGEAAADELPAEESASDESEFSLDIPEEGDEAELSLDDESTDEIYLDTEEPEDLEDINLDIVDDEEAEEEPEEDKTEESFGVHGGDTLVENLSEDAGVDLDVSDEEFEELINSQEFKKPISATEVKAIMDDETAEYEQPVEESVSENVLTEAAITRSGKVDWLMNNALGNDGEQKFNSFVVVCSGKNIKKSNGSSQPITGPIDKPDIVITRKLIALQKDTTKSFTDYKSAEKYAKARSLQSNNGVAFIFLNNGTGSLNNSSFLCQYYKGKLDDSTDKLNLYIKNIKDEAKTKKNDEKEAARAEKQDRKGTAMLQRMAVKKVPAKDVEEGSTVRLTTKSGTKDYVISDISQSKFDKSITMFRLKSKDNQNKTDVIAVKSNYQFIVVDTSINISQGTEDEDQIDDFTTEGLDHVMQGLEELHEGVLEQLISDSLVETYKNVAGFRLAECAYDNNKLTVNGTIHFTSGNTRNTTYSFSNASLREGKVHMVGQNEKLGLDRQFTLTGKVVNKTLITESFKCNK